MFSNITELYQEIRSFKTDKRVRDKFLMGNSDIIITICCVYLIITIMFTRYMKNNPKKIIDVSTLTLIMRTFYLIATCYILYGIVKYIIWSSYNSRCNEFDRSKSEEVIEVSNYEL